MLCAAAEDPKTPRFAIIAMLNLALTELKTASRADYIERAQKLKGPKIDLLDDQRCAFARFCHREDGSAWELTRNSGNSYHKKEAIAAASECPAGRLVAAYKSGEEIEPEYEPSIVIVQDPEKEVSGGIFVKGGIPIESADGQIYEQRNRVVLCRCGAITKQAVLRRDAYHNGFLRHGSGRLAYT